ncbi:MAG: hypothetical protein LC620_04585 [Halobacteriales archaeon]|nr:hypothetical protein [Halobacteriales archaeon]
MPDASVSYRLVGHSGEAGDFDMVVDYQTRGSELTATWQGLTVMTQHIDLVTGLVTHIQTIEMKASGGKLVPDPHLGIVATASHGAPILGSFYGLTGYTLYFNTVPPPGWLDAANEKALLGDERSISRAGGAVFWHPHVSNFNESWVIDHPVFPARHVIDLPGTEPFVFHFEATRIGGPPPAWPEAHEPKATPMPAAARQPWRSIPPLGNGTAGKELSSFFDAVRKNTNDIDFAQGNVLITQLGLSMEPTLPLATPAHDLHAYASIRKDSTQIDFSATRHTVAGQETKWAIERTSPGGPDWAEPPPRNWPRMVPIADLLEARAIDWTTPGSWDVGIEYHVFVRQPAMGAVLVLRLGCIHGEFEAIAVSLLSGEELATTTEPC